MSDVEHSWEDRAACRGPNAALFFSPESFERKVDRRIREQKAKQICRACVVQKECLQYALQIDEPHGIWGGLNETERKALRVK